LASTNTNPLAGQSGEGSPSPSLTHPFYIFGQLFSVVASENAGLLASLLSVLETLTYTSASTLVENSVKESKNENKRMKE
jgi:hypothetical protein